MLSSRKILALLLYFVLATGAAALIRFEVIDPFRAAENGFMAGLLNNVIFIGWTPAIAAFIVWRIFGDDEKRASWFGYSQNASLLIALVPAFVLGAHGVPNEIGINPRGFGVMLGAMLFVYALGEEIGWRGFMHDTLAPSAIWIRALIITLPWYLWHIPYTGGEIDIATILKGLGILATAAFFLSMVSEESRSWMIVGGFHSLGNIGFMGTAVDLPSKERLILAGICAVIMLIIYHWHKPKFTKSSAPL